MNGISGIGATSYDYNKTWGKKTDTSQLSFEESKILSDVNEMVSQVGAKAELVDGEMQSNGMTIEVMGFNICGHDGFVIGPKQLKQMAEDEEYRKQMFEQIKEYIDFEKENQRQAAKINPSNANNAETKSTIITNPDGAKVLMIETAFGVRYIKLSEPQPLSATNKDNLDTKTAASSLSNSLFEKYDSFLIRQ